MATILRQSVFTRQRRLSDGFPGARRIHQAMRTSESANIGRTRCSSVMPSRSLVRGGWRQS